MQRLDTITWESAFPFEAHTCSAWLASPTPTSPRCHKQVMGEDLSLQIIYCVPELMVANTHHMHTICCLSGKCAHLDCTNASRVEGRSNRMTSWHCFTSSPSSATAVDMTMSSSPAFSCCRTPCCACTSYHLRSSKLVISKPQEACN